MVGAGLIAAVAVGLFLWFDSTVPGNPLNRYPGIGWEGTGFQLVPVGQGVVFSSYEIGDSASSRATFTGASVPTIPGLRLRVVAISGPPHYQGAFYLRSVRNPSGINPRRFVSLAGQALRPAPTDFHLHAWLATVALIATPLRSGCFDITGVALHYRVGGTTFTKTMSGDVVVSTTKRLCGSFTSDD